MPQTNKHANIRVQSPMKTFRRILSYLKGYKLKLAVSFACMIANVLCNVGGMFMMSVIIDKFILPLTAGATVTLGSLSGLGALGGIVGIMAAIFAVGAGLHYVYNYLIVSITTTVLQNVRDEMFEKMQALPVRYFDTHTHGDIMSLYTNDTDTLRELLSNGLPTIVTNVLTVIGMFVMMLVLSPLLTLCSEIGRAHV